MPEQLPDMRDPEATCFSTAGEACTPFERIMVTVNDPTTQLEQLARALVLRFGSHVAADTMALLCDEFGGEKPYIPARTAFFRRMYLRHRNEQFVGLAAKGWSLRQIAAAFGVDEANVSRGIAACSGPCAIRDNETGEAC